MEVNATSYVKALKNAVFGLKTRLIVEQTVDYDNLLSLVKPLQVGKKPMRRSIGAIARDTQRSTNGG